MTSEDIKHQLIIIIWLRLAARLVNTNCHHWRASPASSGRRTKTRKGLQAKQSESLRAQNSAMQKPDQNRNNTSHSLYNHPYALNNIQLVR